MRELLPMLHQRQHGCIMVVCNHSSCDRQLIPAKRSAVLVRKLSYNSCSRSRY